MNLNAQICSLADKPHLEKGALSLIEEAFHYQAPHQFKIDFYKLSNQSNWQNFYLLMIGDQIVSTAIFLNNHLCIKNERIPICLIGGLATHVNYRGQGFGTKLLDHILRLIQKDNALALLWSDQSKHYQKFQFLEMGRQYAYHAMYMHSWIGPFNLSQLMEDHKNLIIDLFNLHIAKNFFTLKRDENDWITLFKIYSADVYFSNDFKRYFFVNKGQDLQGIIHEYAFPKEFKDKSLDFPSEFEWWSPSQLKNTPPAKILFACLAKICNEELMNIPSPFDNSRKLSLADIFENCELPLFISGMDSV